MDWPLTGAVAGTLILAGATTAGLSFLYQSSSHDLIVPKAPLPSLMTTDSTRISMDSRRLSEPVAYPSTQTPQVPLVQTLTEPVDGGEIKESTNQYLADDSMARRPSSSDHRKPALPSAQIRSEPVNAGKIKESTNQYLPDDSMARRPSSSDHTKPASLSVSASLSAQPQTRVQEWRAVATARANLFNLGGHLDQSGLVDSMASSPLRDAFKKGKNYDKLPPEAKAWIEAPNINLSKLAPYRALLGIDDSKIEQEQAVKFVRVASTRGIDDAADMVVLPTGEAGNADLLVLPPFH
jgi:hypothetical protein